MASIQKLKVLIIELREDAEVAADCGHHYENLNAAADTLGEFISLLENPPGTTELALLRMGYARATAERDQLKVENERLESEAVYSAAGFDAAREEIARIKAENEALVSALNDILRVTPMGVEAFGIAALVLGELSGAAMGKGEQS